MIIPTTASFPQPGTAWRREETELLKEKSYRTFDPRSKGEGGQKTLEAQFTHVPYKSYLRQSLQVHGSLCLSVCMSVQVVWRDTKVK